MKINHNITTGEVELSLPLTERIPYRRTVWITGFLKTTISGALISTGVVLLFNSITNHPLFMGWNEIGIVIGSICILLAIAVTTIIDFYKETAKEKELQEIDKRAEEIEEEKILRAMEKLEQSD